jgi:hypothetical protein
MVMTDNLDEIKDRLNIPEEMRSCHTSVIGDYYIEGHVPVAAIRKLLAEQPAIDGIALPGMPSGSPGMTGEQQAPFVVYAVADGKAFEFMTL